jgi:hypothetical protein
MEIKFATKKLEKELNEEKAMIDKDHGILSDASAEGPPFDTLNRADY